MRFKKSLFGFKTYEVDEFIENLSDEQQEQREELLEETQQLNIQYNQMKEKNYDLKEDLRRIEDESESLYDKKRYMSKIIKRAKEEAKEEISKIKVNHEVYFNKVIEATSKLDGLADLLRSDLTSLNIGLQNLVNSIHIRTDIEDYVEKVNKIIDKHENNDYENNYYEDKDYLDHISNIEKELKEDLETRRKPKLSLIKTEKKDNIDLYKNLDISRKPFASTHKEKEEYDKAENKSNFEDEENVYHQRPKTALIGERNKDTIDLLRVIVEREGYDVFTTESAEDIAEQIDNKDPYGIIVLDSMIPYIEISSLLKQIRQSNTWCDTPILVLMQESDSDAAAKYLSNGANDYIKKPFNPKELIARINKLNKLSPQACRSGSII